MIIKISLCCVDKLLTKIDKLLIITPHCVDKLLANTVNLGTPGMVYIYITPPLFPWCSL